MNNMSAAILFGAIGIVTGAILFYYVNQFLEKQRELLSTKRSQLKYIYAPLEIMLRMNSQQYDYYLNDNTTSEEREFIEKNIWHPNYVAIKNILMDKSYLLDEMPDELMTLINFISVWLSEYELVYINKVKEAPVFIRPKGNIYPGEVDDFIFQKAGELRKLLTR